MPNDDSDSEQSPRTRRSPKNRITDPTPDTPEKGMLPTLDAAFDDDSARDRLYSALVGTRARTPAKEIAERADCHPDTARKYLDWFAQLGLAIRSDGRPTTYERNEAYFEWRYVSELAAQHTIADLQSEVRDIRERLETYREEYGVDDPGLVDAREVADDTTSIDEVWSDLAIWATLEDELRLHERARQRLTDRRGDKLINSFETR